MVAVVLSQQRRVGAPAPSTLGGGAMSYPLSVFGILGFLAGASSLAGGPGLEPSPGRATAWDKGSLVPLVQQAYLKASNTETNDFFGLSAAISGDTLVIGAP